MFNSLNVLQSTCKTEESWADFYQKYSEEAGRRYAEHVQQEKEQE